MPAARTRKVGTRSELAMNLIREPSGIDVLRVGGSGPAGRGGQPACRHAEASAATRQPTSAQPVGSDRSGSTRLSDWAVQEPPARFLRGVVAIPGGNQVGLVPVPWGEASR